MARSPLPLISFVAVIGVAGCGEGPAQPPVLDLSIVCSAPELLCENACSNLMTDAKNCGACGAACKAEEFCSSGKCALFCTPGQTACGRSCVNLDGDNANCGACGMACPAGNVCSTGKCLLSCQMGLTNCSGRCTNI